MINYPCLTLSLIQLNRIFIELDHLYLIVLLNIPAECFIWKASNSFTLYCCVEGRKSPSMLIHGISVAWRLSLFPCTDISTGLVFAYVYTVEAWHIRSVLSILTDNLRLMLCLNTIYATYINKTSSCPYQLYEGWGKSIKTI